MIFPYINRAMALFAIVGVAACSSSGGGVDPAASSYTIGGDLAGLNPGKAVVLQSNGGDDLMLSANGPFAFGTPIADGGNYVVTILVQPSGQTCSAISNTGKVSGANVATVSVVCSTNSYIVGGGLSGLDADKILVLMNNGGDDLAIMADGPFAFGTKVADGAGYDVQVKTQPTAQTCAASGSTGTVNGADVTSISIVCSVSTYTVGGAVTGLTGSGLVLANSGVDLPVVGDGFIFPAIADGSSYAVTVKTQPSNPTQQCSVSQGDGTISGADVTDVLVSCATRQLVSIAVTPANPFIAKGVDRQMTATGTYDDQSSLDITGSVTWSTSDPTRITIGQTSGLASFAKVGGPVTITATGPGDIKGEVTLPARNVMFTTSVSGSAILGSWTEAGGQTGLAAGDAICANLATSAGLAGTFRAWLSDDTDDAYCRIAGTDGQRLANCNLTVLPTPSGPWIRTDGFPYMEDQERIFHDAVIYSPLIYDESGNALASGSVFLASTLRSGVFGGATACANWTNDSSADAVYTTEIFASDYAYTFGSLCSGSARLACFQVGAGSALPPFAMSGKKIFVTAAYSSPAFGGVTGADAFCQSSAAAAKLANADKFKAWISDSQADAKDRFVSTTGPYVRVDGVKVADDLASLTAANLFSGISVTEAGGYVDVAGAIVWTGTQSTGIKAAQTCNDWTTTAVDVLAATGRAGRVNAAWTANSTIGCNFWSGRFYCIEDQ